MRRPPLLFVAGILALLRVFVLGFVAVNLGMTDFGGPRTALLRLFQLQGLGFALFLFLVYLREAIRKGALLPLIVLTAASPICSLLVFRAFLQDEGVQSANPMQTIVFLLALVVLDFAVLGFAYGALMAERRTHSRNEVRDDRDA